AGHAHGLGTRHFGLCLGKIGVGGKEARHHLHVHACGGACLTDDAVLVEAGTAAGMDGEMVARLLATDADLAETEAEVARAQTMGVTGVPCFILDRKYVVSGAQPAHILASAIRQVEEARQTGTDLTAQPH
ncbi:MAG: DsbA family protein, partial [Pseudomonadota bacterium]